MIKDNGDWAPDGEDGAPQAPQAGFAVKDSRRWDRDEPEGGDGQQHQQQPMSGKALVEHCLESASVIVVASVVTAWMMPRQVPLWFITTLLAVITVVTWYTVRKSTNSSSVAGYVLTWGLLLTAWFAVARLAGPWHVKVLAALVIPAAALGGLGVVFIGRHREVVREQERAGAERQGIARLKEWQQKIADNGGPRVRIIDVRKLPAGLEVTGRLAAATARRTSATFDDLVAITGRLAASERLNPGGAFFTQPENGSAADFTLHIQNRRHGPRQEIPLPLTTRPASVHDAFGLGLFDDGREDRLLMREICVLIIGLRGSGKSSLLNVFLAQLAACTDVLIWFIDMKGGRTARPWMTPYLEGFTPNPVIDWLATDRTEAKIMLETAHLFGQARAASGIGWERHDLNAENPAIVIICDDAGKLLGHGSKDEGVSSWALSAEVAKLVETWRSEGLDFIGAAQRAVMDLLGSSSIKSQAEVRVGLRVADKSEGDRIFPDHSAAARMVASLRDPGDAIIKYPGGITPPVHLYRVPSQGRIYKHALWTGDLRPKPERELVAVGGEAYAQRWQRSADLLAKWRESAGIREEPAGGGGDEFDQIIAHLREDPERIDPRRRAILTYIYQAQPEGLTVAQLEARLINDEMPGNRVVMHRWLAGYETHGIVRRGRGLDKTWTWTARGDEDQLPPGIM